jgi:hypothetical protein
MKIKQPYLTADDARKLADNALQLQGEFLRAETENALKLVKEAAEQGEASVHVYFSHKVVFDRLKALGYTVKAVSDQRDGDYMVISWRW